MWYGRFLEWGRIMIIDIFIGVADKGGVENVINATATYLVQKGNRVRLIQAVWEHHPWTVPEIEFHYLSDRRDNQDSEKWKKGYASFLREYGHPDVILAANWPLMSFIAKQTAVEEGLHCRVLSWLHSPIARYQAAGYGGMDMLRFADGHLAISKKIERELKTGIPGANVVRVNNPVASGRVFYAEKHVGRNLLFVGRLSPEKNVPVILYALKKAHSVWTLSVIGEGSEEKKLKKFSKENELTNQVRFLGWDESPFADSEENSFLVMSSLYEGFPVTAVEALLSGLPVISTPVDGIVELIRPGENGFLYPQNDGDGLAEVLDYIADGVLPIPRSDVCRASAEAFLAENALPDFYEKLKGLI